jgi:hypothetical protein
LTSFKSLFQKRKEIKLLISNPPTEAFFRKPRLEQSSHDTISPNSDYPVSQSIDMMINSNPETVSLHNDNIEAFNKALDDLNKIHADSTDSPAKRKSDSENRKAALQERIEKLNTSSKLLFEFLNLYKSKLSLELPNSIKAFK